MTFFVKVIPPSKRARIHLSTCRHCRDGQGQVNQDMIRDEDGMPSGGVTYWRGPFNDYSEAKKFMDERGYPQNGIGNCGTCLS